jgi:hypothetical protein
MLKLEPWSWNQCDSSVSLSVPIFKLPLGPINPVEYFYLSSEFNRCSLKKDLRDAHSTILLDIGCVH